jgi:drug/metabolite transporter (DMT)-like permease
MPRKAMALWIPVTLVAAAVQTARLVLQKRLKGLGLSTAGATFARFFYAAPLALAGLTLLVLQGQPLPPLPAAFWLHVVLGGVTQIAGTLCTVALFSERSFAVGVAFTKSEVVQVAAFSALILGEAVAPLGWAAILTGTVGVLILSRSPIAGVGVWNRAAGLGLAAGAFFALSAIGYRGATLEVAAPSALFRAMTALAAVTTLQTLVMLPWLILREPGELPRVRRHWRATGPVGVLGMLGSLGWFVAFALMNAAYVRALGQVELIFSAAASVLIFHERITRREVLGMALLLVAILGIIVVA